jgi:hypothetical protein
VKADDRDKKDARPSLMPNGAPCASPSRTFLYYKYIATLTVTVTYSYSYSYSYYNYYFEHRLTRWGMINEEIKGGNNKENGRFQCVKAGRRNESSSSKITSLILLFPTMQRT